MVLLFQKKPCLKNFVNTFGVLKNGNVQTFCKIL